LGAGFLGEIYSQVLNNLRNWDGGAHRDGRTMKTRTALALSFLCVTEVNVSIRVELEVLAFFKVEVKANSGGMVLQDM
jgi:hypothetical protein